MNPLIDSYEKASAANKAEALIWITEHPPADLDYVQAALAGTNALDERELLFFFEELKKTTAPELWKLLTT